VHQLFPPAGAVDDPAPLYQHDERPAPRSRPWIVVNMVAAVDGAVSVAGRSAGLSGPADRTIFHALRAVADMILVGAGTVRDENYGPPKTSAADQRARLARGQAAYPTIAVVSGRLHLDADAHLFDDTPTRPLVIGTERAEPARRAALARVADVETAGDQTVDASRMVQLLRARGAEVVVCEGGPTLNGTLLAAGVVDELCLTISPLVAAGDHLGIVHGPPLDPPVPFSLARVLEDEGYLFVRYLART
jgi:riboflavin-specific deaminase-like protein